jgi:hypothetical protein
MAYYHHTDEKTLLHLADQVDIVYKDGSYHVLRLIIKESQYTNENEYLGVIPLWEFIVVLADNNEPATKTAYGQAVLADYHQLIEARKSEYDKTHPCLLRINYPEELYFIL